MVFSLFVTSTDIRRFQRGAIGRRAAALVGPTLADAWDQIERAAGFASAQEEDHE